MILRVVLGTAWFVMSTAVANAEPVDEEAEIRSQVELYAAAYNNRDAQGLAEFWSPNAVYMDLTTGERIEGREAIAAMFVTHFQSAGDSRLSLSIDSIRLVTPDVGIEDGRAQLIVAGGEPLDTTYTAVHVKMDGVWLLDSVRETNVPTAAPSNLDQLAWLIGTWEDQDENATVHTHYTWARNNSFISATFSVQVEDRIELEGTQIIGWDAAEAQIRSWVFDSEGGFGSGVWNRVGNQWIVKTVSTLADGSRGSATNVYTLVGDGVYRWKSVDRQLHGELLPDIDEVTVHRQ